MGGRPARGTGARPGPGSLVSSRCWGAVQAGIRVGAGDRPNVRRVCAPGQGHWLGFVQYPPHLAGESVCRERFLPVSYTHLRAHETDSYLVCRLLLAKKTTTKTSATP